MGLLIAGKLRSSGTYLCFIAAMDQSHKLTHTISYKDKVQWKLGEIARHVHMDQGGTSELSRDKADEYS